MSSGRAEFQCFSCNEKLSLLTPISRREECPKCRADVRTCKNCQFYDPKVYNECRETQADPVREKDRSNICDYYAPKSNSAGVSERDALLAAAEALFKRKN